MFPIPWNKAYRKKDGTLVNIDDAMSGGGGSSELPPHSAADAGKVLGVLEDGTLGWVTVSGGGNRYSVPTTLTPNIDVMTSGKGAE